MAIQNISDEWKEHLRVGTPMQERVYWAPRVKEYPPIIWDWSRIKDDPTDYAVMPPAENASGSHYLKGDGTNWHKRYAVDFQNAGTVQIKVRPTFAYNGIGAYNLITWQQPGFGSTAFFKLEYLGFTTNQFRVRWQDNGTVRELVSHQFTSDGEVQQWQDIVFTWNIGSGTGSLWINGVLEDSAWSGALDTYASSLIFLTIADSEGYTAFAKYWPGVTVSTVDVQNGFKNVFDEEIYWGMNANGLASTRCQIPPQYVKGYTFDAQLQKKRSGVLAANKMKVELRNFAGIFSDDQYGAYDPSVQQYNGLSTQRYLQQGVQCWAETWYETAADYWEFEPFFVGRTRKNNLKRNTVLHGSRVQLDLTDAIEELALNRSIPQEIFQGPVGDWQMVDLTDIRYSVFHQLIYHAMDRYVDNYLGNSDFENATISNSWLVIDQSGSGGTLTRYADPSPLFGTYTGQLTTAAANFASAEQFVDFPPNEVEDYISVGETFTFGIYLKTSDVLISGNNRLFLYGHDGATPKQSANQTWSLVVGEGWTFHYVQLTISDATVDRMRVYVGLGDASSSIEMDNAVLYRGQELIAYHGKNDNDGTAGLISALDKATDRFRTIGVEAPEWSMTHPWPIIDNPWETCKEIGNASGGVIGIGSAGEVFFKTPLADSYTDPTPAETISSTWRVSTRIDAKRANAIEIRGIRILNQPHQEVWNARAAGLAETDKILHGDLDTGEYWPDTVTPSQAPLWAIYQNIKITPRTEGDDKWWTLKPPEQTFYDRTVVNEKDVEIVGMKSLAIWWSAAYWSGGRLRFPHPSIVGQILEERLDRAHIRLYNASGPSNGYLHDCMLRGSPVKRYSNEQGYLNDRFRDLDHIRLHGEKRLKIQNNYIISQEQCDKLADYHWERNKEAKHLYSVSKTGAWLWLNPSDWYTLDIGAASTPENIDSTVEMTALTVQRRSNELGSSELSFREVLQNWTEPTSALSRYVATGVPVAGIALDRIKVASTTYAGPAQIYLEDNTGHEAILEDAIEALAGSGGGILELSEGDFYITAASLNVNHDNIMIVGAGRDATRIRRQVTSSVPAIDIAGTSGESVKNFMMKDLTVIEDQATQNAVMVLIEYTSGTRFERVRFEGSRSTALGGVYGDNFQVVRCEFLGNTTQLGGYQCRIDQITDFLVTDSVFDGDGVAQGDFATVGISGSPKVAGMIKNNTFRNSSARNGINGASGTSMRLGDCFDVLVEGNTWTNCWGTCITIASDSRRVQINDNQFADTGLTRYAWRCLDIQGDDCMIVGNQFMNHESGGDISPISSGISVIGLLGDDATVSNNKFRDCGNFFRLGNMEQDPNTFAASLQWETADFVSNVTLAEDNTIFNFGTGSAKVTKFNAAGTAAWWLWQDNQSTSDLHGMIPGVEHVLNAHIYVPTTGGPSSAAECKLYLGYYRSGSWTYVQSWNPLFDTWVDVKVTQILPTDAEAFWCGIFLESTMEASEFVYVDDIRLYAPGKMNRYNELLMDFGTDNEVI